MKDWLSDTLLSVSTQTKSIEQNYTECRISIRCYNGQQKLYGIRDIPPDKFPDLLHKACNEYQLTNIKLLISGYNNDGDKMEVFMRDYQLPEQQILPQTVNGYGRLGHVDAKALYDTMMKEQIWKFKYEHLLEDNEKCKQECADLNKQVAALEGIVSSNDKTKQYLGLIEQAAPLVSLFFPQKQEVAKAGNTLAGTNTGGQHFPPDSEQAIVSEKFHELLPGLNATELSDMFKLLSMILENKLLLNRWAHPETQNKDSTPNLKHSKNHPPKSQNNESGTKNV